MKSDIRFSLGFIFELLIWGCADEPQPEVLPIKWNETIQYSSIIDERDGKVYKTMKMGSQKWMAQNLDYSGKGKCYHNENAYCPVYGRLYTWYDLGIDSSHNKGICPTGWHVPNNTDWLRMVRFATTDPILIAKAIEQLGKTRILVDDDAKDSLGAVILKSADGWNETYIALDYFGFRIIPYFPENLGYANAVFWSSTSNHTSIGSHWGVYRDETYIGVGLSSRTEYHSLRCINDTIFPY